MHKSNTLVQISQKCFKNLNTKRFYCSGIKSGESCNSASLDTSGAVAAAAALLRTRTLIRRGRGGSAGIFLVDICPSCVMHNWWIWSAPVRLVSVPGICCSTRAISSSVCRYNRTAILPSKEFLRSSALAITSVVLKPAKSSALDFTIPVYKLYCTDQSTIKVFTSHPVAGGLSVARLGKGPPDVHSDFGALW